MTSLAINNNNQVVIDSIAKLTAEITILRTSLSDHKESTSRQVEELKLQFSKQNEIVVKQQIFLEQLVGGDVRNRFSLSPFQKSPLPPYTIEKYFLFGRNEF